MRAFAAIGLGFFGVVLLLKPTLQAEQWVGALAGLGSGLIASVAYVNVRELGRAGEPEARTVLWFSGVTSLFGLAWPGRWRPATCTPSIQSVQPSFSASAALVAAPSSP
jgi:drug/metabolite transporter (DMT)-like permease